MTTITLSNILTLVAICLVLVAIYFMCAAAASRKKQDEAVGRILKSKDERIYWEQQNARIWKEVALRRDDPELMRIVEEMWAEAENGLPESPGGNEGRVGNAGHST